MRIIPNKVSLTIVSICRASVDARLWNGRVYSVENGGRFDKFLIKPTWRRRFGWPIRMCRTVTAIQKGPGDHLHDLILRWFGEEPTDARGCNSYVNMMNAWGVEGCRRRIDRIARKLFVESRRRGLLESRIPGIRSLKRKAATILARAVVRRAIAKTRRTV
jgi:hypothetical protein